MPLALAVAAALLRLNPSLSLQDLRAQIEADPLFDTSADAPEMQAALREAGLPTRRALGVTATFAISYRQLQAADPVDARALQMLHCAAYCAPAPIPQRVLWQGAGLDSANPTEQTTGDAATCRLRALGLVDALAAEHAGKITLHRLLAAFVRQQPHPEELLGTTATALANYTRILRDAGQIKRSLELVPHLEAVLAHQSDAQGPEHPATLATARHLALLDSPSNRSPRRWWQFWRRLNEER